MFQSNQNLFRNLGTGVGLRADFVSHFRENPPKSVSWVEVISENFMRWSDGRLPRSPIAVLENVRKNLPVVLHGVSMSLGSTDSLDLEYMKHLKELVDRIQPSQVSDHLCWTGVNGENLHDLLPLPYTEEALQNITKKIVQAQDFLGRRILIENLSSYVEFENSEMTEWEFLKEVTERADCGILLDLNNVYVSSVNHNFDPIEYLMTLPSHRVGQIHLAGHKVKDGFLLDTHDEDVCDEVWDLYTWVLKNIGSYSTMIERDGNIPEWTELEQEVLKASTIGKDIRSTYKGKSNGEAHVASTTI